jgi:cation transport ATPase
MRLADRAARLYAPLVHAPAALVAIGWLVAGRFRSRIHRHCHRRAHHHLPTRNRSRR